MPSQYVSSIATRPKAQMSLMFSHGSAGSQQEPLSLSVMQ